MDNPDDEFFVNDFYDLIDMDNTTSGAMVGWKPYDKSRQLVKVVEKFDSCLDDFNREVPCCMIDFNTFDVNYRRADGSRVY